MFDKVEYWLELCDDDMKVAKNLFRSKDYLWMSFLCHLVVEKSIKAVIADRTEQEPKRIHDLVKLSEQATLVDEINDAQMDLLEELTPFNLEARYPCNTMYNTPETAKNSLLLYFRSWCTASTTCDLKFRINEFLAVSGRRVLSRKFLFLPRKEAAALPM